MLLPWLRKRHALVFACLAFLITIMVILALRSSLAVNLEPLEETTCMMNSIYVEVDEENADNYRCRFTVSDIAAWEEPKKDFTAYRYATESYNLTEAGATECKELWTEGEITLCYVSPRAIELISMEMGQYEGMKSNTLLFIFVFGSTCGLLAMVGLIVLIVVVSSRAALEPVEVPMDPENPADHEISDLQTKQQFTKEEVRTIVSKTIRPSEEVAQDFVCAICLDGGGIICRLACEHSFHCMCFKVWLRRGGRSCPMCKAPIDLEQKSVDLEEKE